MNIKYNEYVRVVFLDLRRTFETINTDLLLERMRFTGYNLKEDWKCFPER